MASQKSTIGQRIKQAREAKGLSAKQLARLVGVETGTVYKWEADKALPRPENAQQAAAELDVSLSWLLALEPVEASTDGLARELRDLQEEIRELRRELRRLGPLPPTP